jgi:4-amino-4-deoxy-L-arabinose transferase-like glycosyltransferase
METITTLPKVEPQKASKNRVAGLLQKVFQLTWQQVGLIGIMGLSASLYLFRLEDLGYSNEYYASAVKSMLASWSNFFFGAFDPGGYITVDKPPVFLWIQAASAWLFGFSGFSILLPQIIAGVASVAIIYHLVKRVFGPGAGLLAALALTLTPIFLVMTRHNNPESLLILSLLLAVWALTRAAEKGQLRWLLVSVGMVGIAFNIKMLEGFIILPALYGVYFLMGRTSWWKRILHLGAATLVLAVVAFSWTLIVDAIPANSRPYIGSSSNNTVSDLILGYNGLGRVEGNTGNFGGGGGGNFTRGGQPSGQQGQFTRGGQSGTNPNQGTTGQTSNSQTTNNNGQTSTTGSQTGTTNQTGGQPGGNFNRGGFGGNGGGMGGGNSAIAGRAGPFRLFLNDIAGEVNWLAPLALLGVIVLIIQSIVLFRKGKEKFRSPRNTAILIWLGWFACFGVVFSMAQGTFHSYYLVLLAPPVAALFGAGTMAFWKELRQGRWLGWLLPVALLANAAYQVYILAAYPTWGSWLNPLILTTSVAGASVLVGSGLVRTRFPRFHNWISRIGLALTLGLLVAPAAWAINQLYVTPVNPTLPSARPGAETELGMLGNRSIWDNVAQPFWADFATIVLPLALLAVVAALVIVKLARSVKPFAGKLGLVFPSVALVAAIAVSGFSANTTWAAANEASAAKSASTTNQPDEGLIRYLEANQNGEKYLVAVSNTSQAAPIILETGQAVMAIGGFMGTDNSLSATQAARMVSAGQVRYFLISGNGGNRGGFGSGGSTSVSSWVTQQCTVVNSSEYATSTTTTTTANSTGGQNFQMGSSQETLYDCGAVKTN